MATPMTATQFAAALRAEGLTVEERSGWSTHNRNTKGAWGPLNGVMIHHTVSSDGPGIIDLCYNGRSDLPGPLCHGVIHKDGSVTLVGWGRANHAGSGDPDALAAVVAESPTHPAPNTATVDGNAHFVGFECVNWGNGTDPWPTRQVDAIARAAAAVCRHYGWSAESTIGHKEWTNQKVDPRGFTMAGLRDLISERLAHAADWNPTEEDDVALTADDVKKVWLTDGFYKNPNPATAAANPYIAPATGLSNVEIVARRIEAKQAVQQATIDKLVTAVATLAANIGDLDPAAIVTELKASIESITIHLDVPEG